MASMSQGFPKTCTGNMARMVFPDLGLPENPSGLSAFFPVGIRLSLAGSILSVRSIYVYKDGDGAFEDAGSWPTL